VSERSERPNEQIGGPERSDGAPVNWERVSGARLARQGLTAPLAGPASADRLAEVVRAMCGAHAQVMSAGELSIGLRVDGATRDDVQHALWTERTLVKTRGPRGTVHLLPSADLPIWTGALATVPQTGNLGGVKQLLTPDQVEQVLDAIAAAVADDELTDDELTAQVVARAGSWAGDRVMDAFQDKWPRWKAVGHLAMWRGAMCFGPTRGRVQTFTSPRRWLPGFEPADPDTATAELLRHYLRAYGPATPQHFARWLTAPARWAAELFESLGDELQQVELEGLPCWRLRAEPLPEATVRGVRLLPYFDAYAIAAQPRELLFAGKAAERALAGGQAGNFPVVLVDGVVAGVWHLRRSGRRTTITVEPIGRPAAVIRRGLESEVARVGEFFGGPAELVIGPVAVGPHA
jgi:hypothetical protein